jgi:hypothetical protein
MEGAWGIRVECHQFQRLLISLILTAAIIAWTPSSSGRSSLSSDRSWGVNWFFRHLAVVLAFSFGWDIRPKGPWIAPGVFDPSFFVRDCRGPYSSRRDFVVLLPPYELFVNGRVRAGSRLSLFVSKVLRSARLLFRSKVVTLVIWSLYFEA